MDGKYYVIAGNNNQYLDFAKKKVDFAWYSGNHSVSLSDFVYVHNPDQLRGLKDPDGYFVGTWYDHDFIREILNNLIICMYETTKRDAIIHVWGELNKYEAARNQVL